MATVILVPGHLCGAWHYEPQRQTLSGHEVRLADIGQDDTILGMAERLLTAAPDRFVVAGLSMGGMVAMEVMGLAPERLLGACLMDTDPNPAREKEIEWRSGLLARGLPEYAGTFVDRFFLHDPDVAAALGPETRRRMLQTPAGIARAQARALDTRRAMVPRIAAFPRPVEIIVGSEDRICPPKLHEALARSMPAASMTEITGCGHLATLERPEEVNRRLAILLDGVEAAGGD